MTEIRIPMPTSVNICGVTSAKVPQRNGYVYDFANIHSHAGAQKSGQENWGKKMWILAGVVSVCGRSGPTDSMAVFLPSHLSATLFLA